MIARFLISFEVLAARITAIRTAHEGAKPHPSPIPPGPPPKPPPKGNWAEATPDSASTIVGNFMFANYLILRIQVNPIFN